MNSGKRTHLILWSSAAAAAAGIAAVVAVVKYRERHLSAIGLSSHLRDVQDVLTDCYSKISEIEARLPAIVEPEPIPAPAPPRKSVRTPRKANGRLATEK